MILPVALVLSLAYRGSRKIVVALAAGSFVIAGLTYVTSNVRHWEVPLAEIIAGRVLHKPAELSYFVRHGMPTNPQLESELWASRSPLSSFETTPALA